MGGGFIRLGKGFGVVGIGADPVMGMVGRESGEYGRGCFGSFIIGLGANEGMFFRSSALGISRYGSTSGFERGIGETCGLGAGGVDCFGFGAVNCDKEGKVGFV